MAFAFYLMPLVDLHGGQGFGAKDAIRRPRIEAQFFQSLLRAFHRSALRQQGTAAVRRILGLGAGAGLRAAAGAGRLCHRPFRCRRLGVCFGYDSSKSFEIEAIGAPIPPLGRAVSTPNLTRQA